MEKLSRPYQIALGALVVLALAWFTVLKPSDPADAEVASVPGATGLSTAVGNAQGAAVASDANAAALQAAAATVGGAPPVQAGTQAGVAIGRSPSGVTGTTGAKGAKRAAARRDPSAPILRAVAKGKVAIVLFYSRQAADDRAVRRALLAADRHNGRVVVRAVPIGRVAEYAAISEGVDVLQAPTLLVIGRGNRARSIVGFTDTRAIDQLVEDVGGAAFAPRRKGYRGTIVNICATTEERAMTSGLSATEPGELFANLRDAVVDARRALRRLDPPRRYVTFHREYEKNLDLGVVSLEAAVGAQRAGKNPLAVINGYMPRFAASEAKLDAAAKRVDLPKDC